MNDRRLGMDEDISRRDFLNGVRIAIGGTLLPPVLAMANGDKDVGRAYRQNQSGYYPPTLDELRGSHAGSFEVAHQMRDGRRWDSDTLSTGEHYDLVVVGGGISGLASAWFYKRAKPEARVLIIDNHDDFGGHAKRNEFHYNGKTILDLAGSFCSDIRLAHPLRYEDYQSARTPNEPLTVHMYRIPLSGRGKIGEQFRLGRYELLEATYADIERKVRQQLSDMLAPGGFDPVRDIKGITVNRWPHGYAVGYDAEKDVMNNWSDAWPADSRTWLKGRRQFGRISIANSDAGASAMTESAIEQGFRATQEILN